MADALYDAAQFYRDNVWYRDAEKINKKELVKIIYNEEQTNTEAQKAKASEEETGAFKVC